MSLVNATYRIVADCQPRYWVLENTRGAVKFLGQPALCVFPFYLWGVIPDLGHVQLNMKQKQAWSSRRQAERAMVPAALSRAVAIACEQQSLL